MSAALLLSLGALAPTQAAQATTGAAPASPGACVPLSSAGTRGAAAVAAIGSRWERAAAVNGLSSTSLRRILREDTAARLDRCSRLFYVEPASSAAGQGSAPSSARRVTRAVKGTGEAFSLDSRPSAQKTIYLDFTGHRVTGTVWNEYFSSWGRDHTLAPYDADGDPSSFGATERKRIREIWERVSEDYAPFDVNVTTREPGNGDLERSDDQDTVYGTRAVITGDASMVDLCGCSGIAALGVFDLVGYHGYYQPALINPAAGTSAADIANVVSHEVGHTLGLSHDGRAPTSAQPGGAEYYAGQGVWRPIMGAGPASSRPLSQWSRGEYADANNAEDDLDVIASHGPKVIGDDHGDTAAGATVVKAGETVQGRITTYRDSDWFVVSVPQGRATITLTPKYAGGNLDARLDLFDLGGLSLARDNPVAAGSKRLKGLDARIVTDLSAGTYNIRVKGVGNGIPDGDGYSAYGSLGRYTLTVDVAR